MATALKLSPDRVHHLPLSKLTADPNQPRKAFGAAALTALAENIKLHGIEHPITVRQEDGKIIIKDGERRWRAAKEAKLKTVPVLLVQADDAVQRSLDQVAVNSLRSELAPMDLARHLVELRDKHRMTPNDIAARMVKDGMRTLTRSHVENLVKLVELPDWAHPMVDNGQLDAAAARPLVGIKHPGMLKTIKKALTDELGFAGKLLPRDVEGAITGAYDDEFDDLKAVESYRPKPVLFDYKKVCKGCEHLAQFGGGAWCMNTVEFQKHQAEAKAAGLGPGGALAKGAAPASPKSTAAQERAAEKAKAAEREAKLEHNVGTYLHAWLQGRISEYLDGSIPDEGRLASRLATFAVADRPGVNDYQITHDNYRQMRVAARGVGYKNIGDFLAVADTSRLARLYLAIAQQLVRQLPYPQIQAIAHFIWGDQIGSRWKIDDAYIQLLRKAELIGVAQTHCQLPEGMKSWESAKVGDLQAAILAAADTIPAPAALQRLYTQVEELEEDTDGETPEDDEDFDDDSSAREDG
jgi:ParB family chromosome partitioning protein